MRRTYAKNVILIALSLLLAAFLVGCNASQYKEALKLSEEGKYDEAAVMFEELENYKDSPEQLRACKYQIALQYIEKEDYDSAAPVLEELNDYLDADELLCSCKYKKAVLLEENEDFVGAIELYEEITDYEDADGRLEYCKREKGMRENADYRFLEAIEKSVTTRMEGSTKLDQGDASVSRLELVNGELAALGAFENENFYNEDLKECLKSYLNGLKMQKEAEQNMDENPAECNIQWRSGLVERCKVLKELYESYDFLTDNTEFISTYVLALEDEENELAAYQEIHDAIQAQIAKNSDYYSFRQDLFGGIYTLTFENTTTHRFSAEAEMSFYDANNTKYLTLYGHNEGVAPGEKFSIEIYLSSDQASRAGSSKFQIYYFDVVY